MLQTISRFSAALHGGVALAVPRAIALAIAAASTGATAESLRCEGSSAAEGDSKLSVLYKCGPPLLKDTYCDAIYSPQSPQPVPEPFASALVPCMPIEEWIYDRGPGNLVATVRFRSGVVRAIVYGRTPR